MKLFYVPLSTYCQKTIMAFHEKGVEFEGEIINLGDPEARAEYLKFYPLGKVPVLELDNGHMIPESSIIIEYLETHFDSGTSLIPADPDLARQVRFKDRMHDLYLNDSISNLFFQSRKPAAEQDSELIERSRFRARVMYEFIERALADQDWVSGEFSMADCAAAPPLLYARDVFPFDDYPVVGAYWERLSARDSWQKVMNEVEPALERMRKAS